MALTIKGVQISLDAAAEALVSEAIVEQATRADAAEAKIAELSTAAGAQTVELAALKSRCDAAEAVAARVARTELEQAVRPVLGAEFKFDGKTDAELKAAVVAKVLPGVRLDGADAAFMQGAYVSALSLSEKASDSARKAAEESGNAGRTDAADPNDPAKAREAMIAERRAMALK